jgi:hypothetical protein
LAGGNLSQDIAAASSTTEIEASAAILEQQPHNWVCQEQPEPDQTRVQAVVLVRVANADRSGVLCLGWSPLDAVSILKLLHAWKY